MVGRGKSEGETWFTNKEFALLEGAKKDDGPLSPGHGRSSYGSEEGIRSCLLLDYSEAMSIILDRRVLLPLSAGGVETCRQ